MDNAFEVDADGDDATEVLERARTFVTVRAKARYWDDLRAWAAVDDGPLPAWNDYEPGVWQELTLLCDGLGALAAIAPELLFPPVDPWPWGG